MSEKKGVSLRPASSVISTWMCSLCGCEPVYSFVPPRLFTLQLVRSQIRY